MKKFIAKNLNEYNITPEGMDIWADEISDGYHTMHELYEHRLALTVALTKYIPHSNKYYAIRSKLHFDGSMFEGDYFVIGICNNQNDKMIISYHYTMKHWEQFNHCRTMDKAPEWDGHTANNTIERLLRL